MTVRGVPCIYYRTEHYAANFTANSFGQVGSDPYNREMMPSFATNTNAQNIIRKLSALRQTNTALQCGSYAEKWIDDSILAYERKNGSDVIFVAANIGAAKTISVPNVSFPNGTYKNKLGSGIVSIYGGVANVSLAENQVVVISSDNAVSCGDFRSEEVKPLRNEADIIITNPPFSLFREFMNWILEANKKFAIIGNMNALNYREIFPNVKENKMWIGGSGVVAKIYLKPDGSFQKMGNTCWFTNIEHGKRHKPLENLTTMDGNIKHSKHKEIRGKGYIHYDNYNAIDVPYTDAIPTDFDGIMGVPISFLDKYCPETKLEIIWRSHDIDWVYSKCDFFTYPSAERLAKFKKADKTWRVQIPYHGR